TAIGSPSAYHVQDVASASPTTYTLFVNDVRDGSIPRTVIMGRETVAGSGASRLKVMPTKAASFDNTRDAWPLQLGAESPWGCVVALVAAVNAEDIAAQQNLLADGFEYVEVSGQKWGRRIDKLLGIARSKCWPDHRPLRDSIDVTAS